MIKCLPIDLKASFENIDIIIKEYGINISIDSIQNILKKEGLILINDLQEEFSINDIKNSKLYIKIGLYHPFKKKIYSPTGKCILYEVY